jgi:hypothetical protein
VLRHNLTLSAVDRVIAFALTLVFFLRLEWRIRERVDFGKFGEFGNLGEASCGRVAVKVLPVSISTSQDL